MADSKRAIRLPDVKKQWRVIWRHEGVDAPWSECFEDRDSALVRAEQLREANEAKGLVYVVQSRYASEWADVAEAGS